ncbi:MAG: hypothetical protein KY462_13675 [Actinobacteria bacterium]|nr:hypothetical protein [Actinomycetota bacterium]
MTHPTRNLRLVTLTATAVLLAAACNGSGQADPATPKTPADTPTAAASPTPAGPTEAEVDALVNDYRKILLNLPPMPPEQVPGHVTDRLAELTTPDGDARHHMLAQANEISQNAGLSFVPVLRGTPHTALLSDPVRDGDSWVTTGCVAVDGQLTDVATGRPGELDPFTTTYTKVALRAVPDLDGGGWLLDEYTPPDDPEAAYAKCVPPDVADQIEINWQALVQAFDDWARRGRPGNDLGRLAELTTGQLLAELRESPGDYVYSFDLAQAIRGHEIVSATPAHVTSENCFVAPEQPPAFETNIWQQVDGEWLLASTETTHPDEPDAPENHRCFAG